MRQLAAVALACTGGPCSNRLDDGSALERLDTITGVARRSAEQILAELGDDMSRFPTAARAASWTGICPGHHKSAGKRKSGRTRHGNRWLRTTLIECARGAVRSVAAASVT